MRNVETHLGVSDDSLRLVEFVCSFFEIRSELRDLESSQSE